MLENRTLTAVAAILFVSVCAALPFYRPPFDGDRRGSDGVVSRPPTSTDGTDTLRQPHHERKWRLQDWTTFLPSKRMLADRNPTPIELPSESTERPTGRNSSGSRPENLGRTERPNPGLDHRTAMSRPEAAVGGATHVVPENHVTAIRAPRKPNHEMDRNGRSQRDRRLRRHLVVDGDTLQSLAVEYLGHAGRYAEILALNQQRIPTVSPEFLPLGVELLIPPRHGSPSPSALEPPRPAPPTRRVPVAAPTDRAEVAPSVVSSGA